MNRKILSVILAVVLCMSVFAAPVTASASGFISAYNYAAESTPDDARPVPQYFRLIKIIREFKGILYDLTGMEKFNVKYFDFVVDDTLDGINDSLYEQTGLNFSEIYTKLPDTGDRAALLEKVLRYDRIDIQDKLNAKAKELKENGESLKSAAVRFFSVWLGIIDHVDAVCEPVEGDPDLVRLTAHIIYRDGRTDKLTSDIYYNTATQCFEGPDGKTALLGYDLNVGNATLTTGIDGLHKFLGFSIWYDLLASQTSIFMDYDTERVYYTYGGKDYLVQLWKGRYFVSNGGELGIYSKPHGKLTTFYQCDDANCLDVSLKITHFGDTIIDLPAESTWWRAGFKMSNVTYDYGNFHYVCGMTFEDAAMMDAFVTALAKNQDISYTVDGLTVTMVWD